MDSTQFELGAQNVAIGETTVPVNQVAVDQEEVTAEHTSPATHESDVHSATAHGIPTHRDSTHSNPADNPLSADNYVIQTSQEIDALGRATANGRTFNGYECNEQGGTVTFSQTALAHSVRLELSEVERLAGLDINCLESLVRAQDSDAFIAQLYILSVLAPPLPMPANMAPVGWISFDDVIDKIGWYPQTTMQRREMHKRLYEFVTFGARAQIIGQRSKGYRDKSSGKEIDTTIHAAAWSISKIETPEQGSLYPETETPVRVEITLSRELALLIGAPQTAQYLPMGEVLGAIPGNKPSGAWARVIGLALASFWRRQPQAALSGELMPTRRELLTHYPPKVAPVEELLESKDGARAIGYWCDALKHLVESGLLAREGEATRSTVEIRSALPPRAWHRQWLDERVLLLPGTDMRAHIEGRVKALPAPKPRKKMGRPRKVSKSQ
jgi:hypothetical protein